MLGFGRTTLGNGSQDKRARRAHGLESGYGAVAVGMPGRGAVGMIAGTRVATPMGWRQIEVISRGDMVLTFDNGMQPVTEVTRDLLWSGGQDCPPHLWPLIVPVGALGNDLPMTLLPEQTVMIELDAAESLYGNPFTLMTAAVLEGYRGIHRACPDEPLMIVTLRFQNDQVVFADRGGMFLCPADTDMLDGLVSRRAAAYDVQADEDAAFLLECAAILEERSAA